MPNSEEFLESPQEKTDPANPPLVSILIAAFNEEKYILEAINSCLNQTYSHIEIIVTDDGSLDATHEIVDQHFRSDPRVQIFRLPENKGKVAAFNKCFEHSKGDYIAIMGADDIADSNRILLSIKALARRQYNAVCGDCIKFSSSGIISSSLMEDHFAISHDMEFDFHSLLIRPKVLGGTLLIRRELCMSIFPLDESLHHEDWWIPLMATYHRLPIFYIHKPLIQYRMHDSNEPETNILNTNFSTWRTKTQQRKCIHYKMVMDHFNLTKNEKAFVENKLAIHIMLGESSILKRISHGISHFPAIFNPCIPMVDKGKFIASLISPLLSFYMPRWWSLYKIKI